MTIDLQPMRDWLAAHPDPAEPVGEVRGGDVVMLGDGRRSITAPWVRYTSTIDDFWRALEAAGCDDIPTKSYSAVTQRWREANRVALIAAAHLADMDRNTLFNVLRGIQRGERFCDGEWQHAFRTGMFHAGARGAGGEGRGVPRPPTARQRGSWAAAGAAAGASRTRGAAGRPSVWRVRAFDVPARTCNRREPG